jgi:hypothetical protein
MTSKQDLDGIASISSTAIASSAGARTNAKPNYRSQAVDTNIQADIYLFERLCQLSLKQRIEMFAHQSDRAVKKLFVVNFISHFTKKEVFNKTKSLGLTHSTNFSSCELTRPIVVSGFVQLCFDK